LKGQYAHFSHLKLINPYLLQFFPGHMEMWYKRQDSIDESMEAAQHHVQLIEEIAKQAFLSPNLVTDQEMLLTIVQELSRFTKDFQLLMKLCQRLKHHNASELIPSFLVRTFANINTSESFSKAKKVFESYRAKGAGRHGAIYASMAGFHIKRGEFTDAFQILFTYCKRDFVMVTVSDFANLLDDLFSLGRFDLAKRFFEEMHFIYHTHGKLHLAFFDLCLKYNDLKMAESLLPLIQWHQVRYPSIELYLWRCISRGQMDKASQLLLDLYPSTNALFPHHPASFLMTYYLQEKDHARVLQIFKKGIHSAPVYSLEVSWMLRKLVSFPLCSTALCLQAMKMFLNSGRYLHPSLANCLWQIFLRDHEHRSQLNIADFEDFFKLMTQLLLKGYHDGVYLGISQKWFHEALRIMRQGQFPVTMAIFTVVDEYLVEIEVPFKERELWRSAVQQAGFDKMYFKGNLPDMESHLTSAKILKACRQTDIEQLLTLHQKAKAKNVYLTFDTMYAMLTVYRKTNNKESFEMGIKQLIRKLKSVPDPALMARRSLELHEFALSGFLELDAHKAAERYLSLVQKPIPLSVYVSTYFNHISSLKDLHGPDLAKMILTFYEWHSDIILRDSTPKIRPELINQVFWAAHVLERPEITEALLKDHLQDLNTESLMQFLSNVNPTEQNVQGENLVDKFLELLKQEKPVSMSTIHALMKYLEQTNDFKRMSQLWDLLNSCYHLKLDADIVHMYLKNLMKQPGENTTHAVIFILRKMMIKFELNSSLVEDIVAQYFDKVSPKDIEDVLKLSEELNQRGYLNSSMTHYFKDTFSRLGFPFLADELERELNIVQYT
jgi:tetratricopeptide (TPR) repeat protein